MRADRTQPVPPEVVTEAVVLAGGLGTRLQSVVPDLPKPMAPVADRPFLAWLLDSLAANRIRRAVLSVGYCHDAVIEFFGRQYGPMTVEYAIEPEPLGTGGGAARALALLDGAEAFMLNGDTFQELDYQAMAAAYHRRGDAVMVMGVREVADTSRYGELLVSRGRVRRFSTRGRSAGLINAGVYVVPRDLFDRFAMPERFSFERDFLEALIDQLRPVAFPCGGRFIDIGVPEAYQEAQHLLPALLTAPS